MNTAEGFQAEQDDFAWLTTANGRLYDGAGNVVVLKGVVTVNVGTQRFVNTTSLSALNSLRSIGVNCIRCTLQLENGSYAYVYTDNNRKEPTPESVKTSLIAQLKNAIDNASALGMYCIVDWGGSKRPRTFIWRRRRTFSAAWHKPMPIIRMCCMRFAMSRLQTGGIRTVTEVEAKRS